MQGVEEMFPQRNVDLGGRREVAEAGLGLVDGFVGGVVEDDEVAFCEDDGGDQVFVIDCDGAAVVVC